MDKSKIKAAAERYLEDQELVRKHLRGEVERLELDARDIKLAMPVTNNTIKTLPEAK